jgi:O-methyltransferase
MSFAQARQKLKYSIRAFVASRGALLVQYDRGERRERLQMLASARRARPLMLSECDAAQLVSAVNASRDVPGCMAEIGVAYGTSARIISRLCPEKTLHLFDTFKGLPALTEHDSHDIFKQGTLGCPLDSVQDFLRGEPVVFHQGLFPAETGHHVASERFSFVHLDVDLYEGTLGSLEFLYPRMSPGGIILGHDYLVSKGVTKAFTEFFALKPEPLIELIGTHCLVVKLA